MRTTTVWRTCLVRGSLVCCAVLLIAGHGAAQAQVRLPKSVDLAGDFQRLGLTPLDQGDRDVCSLFAITACWPSLKVLKVRPDRTAGSRKSI